MVERPVPTGTIGRESGQSTEFSPVVAVEDARIILANQWFAMRVNAFDRETRQPSHGYILESSPNRAVVDEAIAYALSDRIDSSESPIHRFYGVGSPVHIENGRVRLPGLAGSMDYDSFLVFQRGKAFSSKPE